MRGRKPNIIAYPGGTVKKARPAPDWLSPHARAEWRRVLPILIERKVLTGADYGLLESYCVAYGQIRTMADEITALPSHFVNSEKGGPRPHPAIRLQHEAMNQARRLAAELGLSPVSRSRAGVAPTADNDDEFADMGV